MCTVVNKYKEEYDVYIGRGSIWGNPFPVNENCSLDESLKKYKIHLSDMVKSGKITLQDLADLQGKRLGCFCKPKPCHGDIIKSSSDWAHNKLSQSL